MPEPGRQALARDPGQDQRQDQARDPESGKVVGTAARIAVLTLASRILALLRDICLASLLGAGPLADCLYAALRLPHAGRRLLAEGSLGLGLTSGLLAASHDSGLASSGRDESFADESFARVLAALAVAASLVLFLPTAFCLLWPDALASLLAPGLAPASRMDLAAMLRLALPYLPLAGLAGIAMAALHARGRFFLAACSPCLFNLVFITAALLALGLNSQADIRSTACLLAGAMSLAGLVQAGALWSGACRGAWTLPLSALAEGQARPRAGKAGMDNLLQSGAQTVQEQIAEKDRYQAILPLQRLPMQLAWRLLARSARGLAGAAAPQLFTLVAMILASVQGSGSVTALYFAERLVELPLGLVGVGLGLASLPTLSGLALSGQDRKFAACLADSLAMSLLLSLPACLGLAAIGFWIVPLFFAHGAFDQNACDLTVLALLAYLPGLPGMALGRCLLSGVTAIGKDARAARATMLCLLCLPLFHAILQACLPARLAGMAPALAASLAIWGHAGLLWRCVNRHCALASQLANGSSLLSAFLSALVAGLAAWLVVWLTPMAWPGWTGGRLGVAGMLFLAIIVAVLAWLACLWLCKDRSLALLLASLKHEKRI